MARVLPGGLEGAKANNRREMNEVRGKKPEGRICPIAGHEREKSL
jgi:hypothetical protein